MAAPTVRGYTFGSSNQGTTCDVSAPTPMNVGNTLVMLIGASNNPTITMPSGWNRVASNTGTVRLETWTKAVVSADIGRSIRITMSGQQAIVGVCFVINNNDWSWDGSGYSPSDPVRTAATNTSSTPNPPNVPYGFSGRANVVLCDYVAGNGGSATPPGHTGFPGNTPDSNYQASTYNSAPDGVRHGWASIERSGGSSWDPDAFGISRSALWRAATMVFRDQRAPTPDFTVDEVPGQPNQRTFTVIRNVGDPDVDSWNWDFGTGDGGGGTTQTYAFPGPGTYTVTLTATNSDSAKNSAQDVVIPATGSGISLDGESDGSSPSSATLGLVVQIAGSSAGATTNYGDIGRRRQLAGQSDSGATVYDAAMGGGSTGLPPLHPMAWAYYLDLDSGDVYNQDEDGNWWKQGTIPGTGGGSGGGPAFGTPALALGTANAPGAAATTIRTDATILAFDATAPVAQAFGDAAAVGAAPVAARRDHKHGMPAAPAAERAAASTTPAAIGTAAVGTGTTDARADHVHATGAGVPSTQAFGDVAATGAGPAAAMTDHKHAMPANPVRAQASTTPAAIGTAAVGVGSTDARADHVHATGAGTPTTAAYSDAAAIGTGPAAAMSDHRHGMPAAGGGGMTNPMTTAADLIVGGASGAPTRLGVGSNGQVLGIVAGVLTWVAAGGGASFATPAIVLGTAAAAGAAATVIRSDATILAFDAVMPVTEVFSAVGQVGTVAVAARRDHQHPMQALMDATVPVTQAFGDTALHGAVGYAADAAHRHGMPSASERAAASTTPAAVGTAAVGTGTTDARADHVHATGAGVPSTQAFGDAAATGAGPAAAMTDHKHAMPADPTTPPGVIEMYAGATAPAGYVLCDGSSLLRAGTYANLFAVIGTTFGSVDGTHFTVPDLRQRFPMGKAAAGTGNVLGVTGGAIDHAHSNGVHTHPITAQVTGQQSAGDDTITTSAGSNNSSKRIHTHSLTGNVDIGTASNTGATNPPFIALNFIIRY